MANLSRNNRIINISVDNNERAKFLAFAELFDKTHAYNKNDIVWFNDKLYRAKTNIAADTNFSFTNFELYDISWITNASVKSIGNIASLVSTAPYNDFNTFPKNEIVYCSNNGASISNNPDGSYAFTCITFSGYTVASATIQIISTSNAKTYLRTCFSNTWTPWTDISSKSIHTVGNKNASTAPYNDFDTFPYNEVVLVATNAQTIAHKPDNITAGGIVCVTFAGTESDSASKIQICSDTSGHQYIRSSWSTTWSAWTQLDVLNSCVKYKGNIQSLYNTSPYNDFDTFPYNEIVYCSLHGVDISNNPESGSYAFMCQTIGNEYSKQQFCTSVTGITYFRCKFGSSNPWSDWIKFDDTVVEPVGNVYNQTTTAPYNDLNTYPMNKIVFCSSNGANVAHKPTAMAGFAVVTMAGYSSANPTRLQILWSIDRHLYMRNSWAASWSNWIQIDKEIDNYVNILEEFDNIICIGDSLTWSQVWRAANSARQAKKPYPTVLQNICHNTVTMYAEPGDSATASWNRWKDSFEEKPNALAIIYLATNYGLSDTLATDAPEGTSYTTWADTYTGDYAKMIARLQELNYKIVLIKPWITGTTSGNTLETIHKVIDECGTRFGCAVVEPFVNHEDKFHYYPNGDGTNYVHYNDFGYSWFAYTLVRKIAELDNTNTKYILPRYL